MRGGQYGADSQGMFWWHVRAATNYRWRLFGASQSWSRPNLTAIIFVLESNQLAVLFYNERSHPRQQLKMILVNILKISGGRWILFHILFLNE